MNTYPKEKKPVKHRLEKGERKVLVWDTVKGKYWKEAKKAIREALKPYR